MMITHQLFEFVTFAPLFELNTFHFAFIVCRSVKVFFFLSKQLCSGGQCIMI